MFPVHCLYGLILLFSAARTVLQFLLTFRTTTSRTFLQTILLAGNIIPFDIISLEIFSSLSDHQMTTASYGDYRKPSLEFGRTRTSAGISSTSSNLSLLEPQRLHQRRLVEQQQNVVEELLQRSRTSQRSVAFSTAPNVVSICLFKVCVDRYCINPSPFPRVYARMHIDFKLKLERGLEVIMV